MIDLCYIGNSSNDKIIINNEIYNTLGGSCIYSSFSSRTSFDGKIAIISKVDRDTNLLLKEKQIEFYGTIVDRMTEFIIDESKTTCESQFYNTDIIKLETKIDVNHLHISLRKGVDVQSILENKLLNYNHLSIDVMIHSVVDFIPIIEKYASKIEILFCNINEYNIIKKYVKDIPLVIVTNENKPIIAITLTNTISYNVMNNNNIKSTTGAGDSFIGGFLSKYIINQDIDESISQGIYNSSKSIENIGPLLSIKSCIDNTTKSKLLPNNIIVIGNSCAGKTTFIDYFKNYYNIYSDIDDLAPLLETFMLDDLLYQNRIEEFKKIKNKLKYINNIWEEYNDNINSIYHYTKPAKQGDGHDIIRPILWDYIIQMAVVNSETHNIIQFSRGRDRLYELEFSENVYFRSIKSFINDLQNSDNCIIVNLVSSLETRKNRNRIRFENGGHYVSDDTMDNVYSKDIFEYTKTGENFGYLLVDGRTIPVYTIANDKTYSEIELNEFLEYNVNKVIEYYNDFKEERIWN
ncbi:MAG: PfkB family carbohydrate kinase [Bacilli bacterium]